MSNLAEPGTLPQVIREIRVKLGLTQPAFADLLRVTLPSFYRYEAGKSVPNVATLEILSELAQKVGNEQAFFVVGRALVTRLTEYRAPASRFPEPRRKPVDETGSDFGPGAEGRAEFWDAVRKYVLVSPYPVECRVVPSDQLEPVLMASDVASSVEQRLAEAELCFRLRLFEQAVGTAGQVITQMLRDTLSLAESQEVTLLEGIRKLNDAGLIDAKLFRWGIAIGKRTVKAVWQKGVS